MEVFVQSFAEKLILLERRTGKTTSYRLMSPLNWPSSDDHSRQQAAKFIANSIGLNSFNFIVGIAKQEKNTAAHIDLKDGQQDVFIEMSPNILQYSDVVAATLCHEICHKWLQVHGISSCIKQDNEILTDITTVFLGFGKIMLNGCEGGITRFESDGSTRTENTKVGYLSRDQLAFVYRLVCTMRKIPNADAIAGLKGEALHAIDRCDLQNSHYFQDDYHNADNFNDELDASIAAIQGTQHILANLDKHLTYLDRAFCMVTRDFLSGAHKTLGKHLNGLAEHREQQGLEKDPAMRFLRNLCLPISTEKIRTDIDRLNDCAHDLILCASAFGRQLQQNGKHFPPPNSNMFNHVTCYFDGTRLRLPESSGEGFATCPKCKYRFSYDTKPIKFDGDVQLKKRSWLARLFLGESRKLGRTKSNNKIVDEF